MSNFLPEYVIGDLLDMVIPTLHSLVWNPIYKQYTLSVVKVQKQYLKYSTFKQDVFDPPR